MSLDAGVRVWLLMSIWLMVLSLGARASAADALFLLHRPATLARAFGAMFVAVPLFAIVLAASAPLPAAIKFAIVAMSVGPVPPVLPYKQMKAGADEAYTLGLLVAASIASIVLTPLLVAAVARLLAARASIDPLQVAQTLVLSIGLPLAAGMVLRGLAKGAAEPVARIAQRAGSLILLAAFAAMIAGAWREILGLLGDGGALAIAATVGVGLLAGHLLGGRHRAALALAGASRHPGVALAIAATSFPDQRAPIMGAVLLHLLVNALVTAPYVRWAALAPEASSRGRALRRRCWPRRPHR